MKKYRVLLDSANINCKPNGILSSRIYKYITKNGHGIVKDVSLADYIIINTCGYHEKREKISKELFRYYEKNKKNGARIISVGCLNKIKDNLNAIFPEIEFVSDLSELDRVFLNNKRFEDIKEMYLDGKDIDSLHTGPDKRIFDSITKIAFPIIGFLYTINKRVFKKSLLLTQGFEHATHLNKLYVEIGKGCISNCSYCVIKKARGGIESRKIDQILNDVDKIYDSNKKLCLVGDDCGSYGLDIGENIFNLVYSISEKYPNLGIDLCYMNPFWIQKYEKGFISLLKKVKINSINIPMQSGSEKILKLMNRKYSPDRLIEIVKKLKRVSDKTMFWTQIIVGFPSEDEEDFLKSSSILDFFDIAYVFEYSDREGTASSSLMNKIPPKEKHARKRKLIYKIYWNAAKKILSDFLT